jgi:hypothetical protein
MKGKEYPHSELERVTEVREVCCERWLEGSRWDQATKMLSSSAPSLRRWRAEMEKVRGGCLYRQGEGVLHRAEFRRRSSEFCDCWGIGTRDSTCVMFTRSLCLITKRGSRTPFCPTVLLAAGPHVRDNEGRSPLGFERTDAHDHVHAFTTPTTTTNPRDVRTARASPSTTSTFTSSSWCNPAFRGRRRGREAIRRPWSLS